MDQDCEKGGGKISSTIGGHNDQGGYDHQGESRRSRMEDVDRRRKEHSTASCLSSSRSVHNLIWLDGHVCDSSPTTIILALFSCCLDSQHDIACPIYTLLSDDGCQFLFLHLFLTHHGMPLPLVGLSP